jgi:hypothetical protein
MKFTFSPQENLVFMKLHFLYLSQVNLIIYCLWLSYEMCLLFTELSLRLLHCIIVFVSVMKTMVYVLQWQFLARFAGMRDELVSLCCSASTQQEQIFREVWTQENFKILISVYFCWLFHLWNRLVNALQWPCFEALFRLMREPSHALWMQLCIILLKVCTKLLHNHSWPLTGKQVHYLLLKRSENSTTKCKIW